MNAMFCSAIAGTGAASGITLEYTPTPDVDALRGKVLIQIKILIRQ